MFANPLTNLPFLNMLKMRNGSAHQALKWYSENLNCQKTCILTFVY